jgi:sulfite dehydrogenase (cytochrome) subunit B
MKSLIMFVALGIGLAYGSAAEVTITLPAETGTFKPGKGAELAQANCLICHSVEYISTQPPMARKFWEATLKKMKEKFGAPTPDDALPVLAEYLTTTYGVPERKP